jgi:hypothetical protein
MFNLYAELVWLKLKTCVLPILYNSSTERSNTCMGTNTHDNWNTKKEKKQKPCDKFTAQRW